MRRVLVTAALIAASAAMQTPNRIERTSTGWNLPFSAAVKGGRQVFTTPQPDGSEGRPSPNHSPAIRVGDRLFLAGMTGESDATRGDVRGQTRATLAAIDRTLPERPILMSLTPAARNRVFRDPIGERSADMTLHGRRALARDRFLSVSRAEPAGVPPPGPARRASCQRRAAPSGRAATTRRSRPPR